MAGRRIYRLVSDYGFSDKAWLERGLSAEQAVDAFTERTGLKFDTVDEGLSFGLNNSHPTYYIEEDGWGDEPDWDVMDS